MGLETLPGVEISEEGTEGMPFDGGGDSMLVFDRLPEREWLLGGAFSTLTLRFAGI